MVSKGVADEAELSRTHEEVTAEVDAAIEFAESSPQPSVDRLLDNVYTEGAR